MRLKHVKGAEETVASSPRVVQEPEACRGRWRELFASADQPLYIEIGMGKGAFITTLAAAHPEIKYIGIEKYSSVLVRAIQKQEELQLPNLLLVRMDAEDVTRVFAPDEIDRIYLNFSDPWPKDRHAKRRLTSVQFLGRYEQILTPEGRVEFKTDNMDLFDFSLASAEEAGWQLLAVTRDLHADEELSEGNVMTEYEARFSAKGNPIGKMIIKRNIK